MALWQRGFHEALKPIQILNSIKITCWFVLKNFQPLIMISVIWLGLFKQNPSHVTVIRKIIF